MKRISILTPCYNEEENIEKIYAQVKEQFINIPNYQYEHIFIDNASTDNTVKLLKNIAALDKNVKIIINAINAGIIRSWYYGLLQAYGDAVVFIEADLQTPVDIITALIKKWEEGYKIVAGVKNQSKENPIMCYIRKLYYSIMEKISEKPHIKNFLGVGLYDQSFIERLRQQIDDPYPYFRGLVTELGVDITTVPYIQNKRKYGKSNASFYILYDYAMHGFVYQSKLPIRLASFIGFFIAFLSLIIAIITLINKLVYWDSYEIGLASVIIGLFFFASIQLMFLGIIGEYISAIFIQVRKRPLVIERERINFDTND
ncbi:putative glycosyltransferase [termite gut metagenome]|uniref:Putative glycosyltransferase n=1 Tax=termite gut metagenome TaxID=433724 RepID=A0A5J4RW69_9ZZZZ